MKRKIYNFYTNIFILEISMMNNTKNKRIKINKHEIKYLESYSHSKSVFTFFILDLYSTCCRA